MTTGGTMPPFSERLTLAIVGPLITVILGTLIIGGLIQLITSRAQNRRAKEERRLEQQRSDNDLRHELLADMTESASALYLATQRHWRARREKAEWAKQTRAERAQIEQEISDARKFLDDQYHESRKRGETLESRLSAYFQTSEAQEAWHKVMDLLTVRYFQETLINKDRLNRLYEENRKGRDGKEHSGLTVNQLSVTKAVLNAYRAALKEATELVRTEPLRRRVG